LKELKNYEDDSQHGVFVWRVAHCLEFAGCRATVGGGFVSSCLSRFVLCVAGWRQQMKIYMGELETGNYTLTTIANTPEEINETFKKEWQRLKRRGWAYATWSEKKEDVRIWELEQNKIEWR
jgi:hypothetical protein